MARRGLYQPFIEDRNVRRLHRLKVEMSERAGRTVPMTTLLNRILDEYFTDGRTETGTHAGAADSDRSAAAARTLP